MVVTEKYLSDFLLIDIPNSQISVASSFCLVW